jgi:antitoxin VapB
VRPSGRASIPDPRGDTLNIRHEETERLAAELARLTGETETEAVRRAGEDRLVRLRREQAGRDPVAVLEQIALRCARSPMSGR